MGKTTTIAWTDSTLNLAWGCKKVSAGCDNCYMFRNSPIARKDPEQITYFSMENARKNLPSYGPLIFVNDNTDTFGEFHSDEWRDQIFKLFTEFPDKQFQLLTKRAGLMYRYFKTRRCPDNVWLGVSVEDQGHVFRIDTLGKIFCKTRFVSFEPLLGPITINNWGPLKWIIIGGESGSNSRPMKAEWAESLLEQAHRQEVFVFFKQMGARENRDGAGGDLLNGRRIHEFPFRRIVS